MSHETPDVRGWRLRPERYSLVGEVCKNCEEKIFPPRDICPHCGQNTQAEFVFSGRGTVFSFTTISEPPAGYEEFAPYTIAWVKLDEGPTVTARLTDLGDEEPQIGMRVEMVTRILKKEGERGPIKYGYAFRPPVLGQTPRPARG